MRLVLIKFWRQRLEIMLFNSIAFICVFLPVIFILYYLLPGKIKDIALVAGGAVFFAWGAPVNLVVLAFFILFNLDKKLDYIDIISYICLKNSFIKTQEIKMQQLKI